MDSSELITAHHHCRVILLSRTNTIQRRSQCRIAPSSIVGPDLLTHPFPSEQQGFHVIMSTNASNSANVNVPFFLYKLGITVPRNVTHVLVDSSLTTIPYAAFRDRRHLKEVVLPQGLQAIGHRSFMNCVSLEWINFPSTLTAIGAGAFYCCSALMDVDLSNVTTVGENAFYDCTSLREVTLHKGIQDIGANAFQDCILLEHFNIPSTVTSIGDNAFEDCVSLEEVKLVGGIQEIGMDAFQGCSSLGGIMIPSKAFVIETGAYSNCRFLSDGTITPPDSGQVVIASECLESMSLTGLTEVSNAINAINNSRERTANENLERIRALFANYELEHKKDVTTILELALWKAKVDESKHASSNNDEHHFQNGAKIDDSNSRKGSRINCGSGVIIQNILPFL